MAAAAYTPVRCLQPPCMSENLLPPLRPAAAQPQLAKLGLPEASGIPPVLTTRCELGWGTETGSWRLQREQAFGGDEGT